MPGASDDELLEAGLDLLLEKAAKRRGLVAKPRNTPPPSNGDGIPAHVRREVFERDGGRCQFPIPGGGICGSTYRVQVGHLIARARGGPTTAANCRCECETHNQFQADRDFGKPFMDQLRRRKRRR
jgi:5-methylcytosine-specific restriction endonuclease McrA